MRFGACRYGTISRMEFITSPDVPPPAGHYSHAVLSKGLLFLSGVLPDVSATTPGGFERQVESVLARCASILSAGGCSTGDVVQCTAYIVGVANWPTFNTVFMRCMGEHRPARAVVPVPELHHGALVEIQMIAEVPDASARCRPLA